jgi:hypothetical protein
MGHILGVIARQIHQAVGLLHQNGAPLQGEALPGVKPHLAAEARARSWLFRATFTVSKNDQSRSLPRSVHVLCTTKKKTEREFGSANFNPNDCTPIDVQTAGDLTHCIQYRTRHVANFNPNDCAP